MTCSYTGFLKSTACGEKEQEDVNCKLSRKLSPEIAVLNYTENLHGPLSPVETSMTIVQTQPFRFHHPIDSPPRPSR